jgi:hypothetical protein
MSSPRLGAAPAPAVAAARLSPGTVRPLLDLAFGFLVWAAHLLSVYVATAVACQLGLGVAGASARTSFLTALAIVTMAAVAIVVLHAFRRYRQPGDVPDERFRLSVTIGGDAIAAVAITWQLIAILLVPVCA